MDGDDSSREAKCTDPKMDLYDPVDPEDLDDDSSQSSLDLLKPLDEAAEDDLVDPPEPIEDIGIEVWRTF